MTAAVVTLADAEQRASDALNAAQAARQRVADGDPTIDPAALGAAEAEERFAVAQRDAARQRDTERREQEAAEQLEADREQVQEAWADAQDEPAHVTELRAAAIAAAGAYLRATVAYLDHVDELRERAKRVGLRPPERRESRRSPLPDFAAAILDECRTDIDFSWTHPRLDQTGGIWTGFGG